MRRNPLVLVWLVLGVVCFFSQSWAQCPEDPNDNGVCDTLYVEIWPGDDQIIPPDPHFVRFPIYVTNDIVDPMVDSIAGFIIPLCFTSTNPSANAIIDPAKNKCGAEDLGRAFHPGVFDLNNSIFRDLPSMEDPQELNWMMDLSDEFGPEWDTRILNLSTGSNFWLSLVASGSMDRRFKGGSRVLLATATFTIEDTTMICIDSCHWPPVGRLAFSRSDAITYIPRHFLPVCEEIYFIGGPPPYLGCPPDQEHHAEGHFSGFHFWGQDLDGIVTGISSEFVGAGVENVVAVNVFGVGTPYVEGEVEYDVTDHCQPGGSIYITAWDDFGQAGVCGFDVLLSDSPPEFSLSDTWRALAGYTMIIEVTAVDPDGYIMDDIELEGFWYEPDSLQSPTNSPSWDGGNPGFFTWAPTEADTGNWICSFSATDVCGDVTTHLLSIRVGMPFCGDCTGDGEINVGDVVCLIGYLYKQGSPPDPLCKGDATGDGSIDVADVVVMVNYLFRGSWSPCFDCCAGG